MTSTTESTTTDPARARPCTRANESLATWPPGWWYAEVDDGQCDTITYDTLREEHLKGRIDIGILVTVDADGGEAYAVHAAGLERAVSSREEAVAEYDRVAQVLHHVFGTHAGPLVCHRVAVPKQPDVLEVFDTAESDVICGEDATR